MALSSSSDTGVALVYGRRSCLHWVANLPGIDKDISHVGVIYFSDKWGSAIHYEGLFLGRFAASTVSCDLDKEAWIEQHGINYMGFMRISAPPITFSMPNPAWPCVSLVKQVVGCRDWRVVTPYQLCEWVSKNGRNSWKTTGAIGRAAEIAG